MVVELVILVVCFFLFLFTLYALTKEDFVFLRRNISLDDIFNVAFITAFFSLMGARLLYVVLHFSSTYLNPLVFFLIPYFPGLSLLGGVIGGVISLLIITKRKRIPRGRLLDFFCFAFLSVLPVGYAGYLLTGSRTSLLFSLLPVIYYSFLFLFCLKILLPRFLQGQMKDGMMGLLILMNYSLFTSAVLIMRAISEKVNPFSVQTIILLVLFLIFLIFYIRQGTQSTSRRSQI